MAANNFGRSGLPCCLTSRFILVFRTRNSQIVIQSSSAFMTTTLKELVHLLRVSADELEDNLSKQGQSLPAFESKWALETGNIHSSKTVKALATTVAAAAFQITALVLPPSNILYQIAGGVSAPFESCTRVLTGLV
jgi:hypothetical protein